MKTVNPTIVALIILTGLLADISTASALGAWDTLRHRSGWVLTRGLVYSERGNIIYSHYDESGKIVGDIGPAEGALANARVMSGDEYRQIVDYFKDFKKEHRDGVAKGAITMVRSYYEETEFTTVSGEVVIKPPLLPGTKSVLARSAQQLLIPETSPLLLQANIDLKFASSISGDIKSVLLDQYGRIHTLSPHNIGPKTISHENQRLSLGQAVEGAVSGQGVEVYAPIGGGAVTDENGFFSAIYFMHPCPGFSYWMPSATLIEYPFQHFDAEGTKVIFYPALYTTSSDFCSGYGELSLGANLIALMTQVAIKGIEASISTPPYLHQFYLDINIVNGKGQFVSADGTPVPMGDTAYEYEAPDDSAIVQTEYDFDGDDITENTVLGKIVADDDGEDKFTTCNTTDDDKKYQGIYLSSGGKQPNFACGSEDELADSSQPDFIRLADKATDFQHQGLLKSISEDDFVDTDLYVFRESNGMLITERQGLKRSEISGFDRGGVREGEMFYQMVIRGANSNNGVNFEDSQQLGFSGFQSALQMNPALHKRKADHLRPHEKIRIVAINRKTGYMGTTRALYGAGYFDGMISFPIDDIRMGPPNLKIKAQRQYDIDSGLTKGDEKDYLIGYEGASLTSDTIVKITTQWFDVDGTPLPKGLESLGFTGRLAKVVGTNSLTAEGGQLAQFAIKPGYHVEQVKLGGSQSEHYYVQVSPEKKSGNPNFGGNANGPGPLQYRPQNYVPIKVPLMDETLSWKQFRAYQKLKRDGQADDIPKPEPIYRWYYRPEMQFSMYDLKVNNIFRQDAQGQSVDIYPLDKPAISSSDDMVKIAYNIVEQSAAALEYLGAGQQLTFAVGEHEIEAVVGDDQQIKFTNLAHLAALEPDDFLTMRLYSNNDPGNVLWEFAFNLAFVFPEQPDEGQAHIIVSADRAGEGPVGFFGAVVSPESAQQAGHSVKWKVQGDGTVSSPSPFSANGVFDAQLILPTKSGEEVYVEGHFDGANPGGFKTATYLIEPGTPADIQVIKTGETVIGGLGGIDLDITVTDQFGNLVTDGTLVDIYAPDLAIEGNLRTTDGKVLLRLKGNSIAGNQDVNIIAGTVEVVETLLVHDVDLSFDVTEQVEIGDTVPVNIQATSSYGDLTGLRLDLANHRGGLSRRYVTIADGRGTTEYSAGEHRGAARLFARINEKVNYHDLEVVEPIGEAYILDPVIISDVNAPGSVMLKGMQVGYTNRTHMMVPGTAGATVGTSLVNNLEPALVPLLEYSMKQPINPDGVLEDPRRGHLGTITQVNYQRTIKADPKFAYVFGQDSSIVVDDRQGLEKQGDAGFTLFFSPDQFDSTVVDYAAAGLKLGGDFKGMMAGFALYDWSEQATVTFDDGSSSGTVSVDGDGFARVAIRANAGPVTAARIERFKRLQSRFYLYSQCAKLCQV